MTAEPTPFEIALYLAQTAKVTTEPEIKQCCCGTYLDPRNDSGLCPSCEDWFLTGEHEFEYET